MAYGVNSPFGLRPYGHLISGVNDIKTNSNYTISSNSLSLNKGDPVVYTTSMAEYAIEANGYQGYEKEIQLYNPTVTIAAGGTATTLLPHRQLLEYSKVVLIILQMVLTLNKNIG